MQANKGKTAPKREPSEIPRDHIIKYPNRRLYCRIEGRYITLEDVKARIQDGRPVRVTEKNTGKDLTRHTLLDLLGRLEDAGEGRIDETELRGMLTRDPLPKPGAQRSAA